MQQMGLPYDVAVSMEEAICLTNWTEVGEKVMSTQTSFSGMIQTVRLRAAQHHSSLFFSLGKLHDSVAIVSAHDERMGSVFMGRTVLSLEDV